MLFGDELIIIVWIIFLNKKGINFHASCQKLRNYSNVKIIKLMKKKLPASHFTNFMAFKKAR